MGKIRNDQATHKTLLTSQGSHSLLIKKLTNITFSASMQVISGHLCRIHKWEGLEILEDTVARWIRKLASSATEVETRNHILLSARNTKWSQQKLMRVTLHHASVK
jgi:hypothetical protein